MALVSSQTAPASDKDERSYSHQDGLPRVAQAGDIVTIDITLTPENGYVPLSLFDTTGVITFVLGWGNYLPGLHKLLEGMAVGDSVKDVSIDAGWGERNPAMVVRLQKKKLKSVKDLNLIEVGTQLFLGKGGDFSVIVTEVGDDYIVVDGNPPLAGASFECNLKVMKIQPMPTETITKGYITTVAEKVKEEEEESSLSQHEKEEQSHHHVATFALGCFWAGELAFMRLPGVVGTKVGYTQGHTVDPTYEEVCQGKTNHREAIMVVYDPQVVSYEELLQVAKERLELNSQDLGLHRLFGGDQEDEDSPQYKHGIYYHTNEQKIIAEKVFGTKKDFYQTEIRPATKFNDAEYEHQQYLLKGGQSARKGTKESIRCFG
mmetsp:Transcript_10385/g.14659  ORF Transcript_10385/g.14659 Transcript_10385/m.14659 type:complete len:375 (-) Transcript_10385:485-1609(-)